MFHNNPKRILYTPPRGIGDFMFSLPLLHSLKHKFPNAEIFSPIPRDKQGALNLIGFVKKTQKFLPKPSDDPLAAKRWEASKSGNVTKKYKIEKQIYEKYLHGENFDLALIPKNFHINSISCDTQISDLDLQQANLQTNGIHMVDRFLKFAEYLGIEKEMCFDLNLNKTDPAMNTHGDYINIKNPYIILSLDGSTNKKIWTQNGYSEVAKWGLKNGFEIILVGDPRRYQLSTHINGKGIHNMVLPQGYSFNLENFAKLAYHSQAIVSPDTGVAHLSDAIGAHVIGLYGPTSPIKYAPYNNQDNVVSTFQTDKDTKSIQSKKVIEKLEKILK